MFQRYPHLFPTRFDKYSHLCQVATVVFIWAKSKDRTVLFQGCSQLFVQFWWEFKKEKEKKKEEEEKKKNASGPISSV